MNYMYFLQCCLCCVICFRGYSITWFVVFGVLILDLWVGLHIWKVDITPNNKQHIIIGMGLFILVYSCMVVFIYYSFTY